MVSPDNLALKSEDGVLFSKDGSILVEYPCGRKDKKYHIPLGTEQIYKFAFWKTNCLEELIIPEGVVSIGEGAIEYCSNLKYLIIPSTLQKFGDKSEISGLWYIGLHYIENKSDIVIKLRNDFTYECISNWEDESRNTISELKKGIAYPVFLMLENNTVVRYYKGEVDTEYTGICTDAHGDEWLVENGLKKHNKYLNIYPNKYIIIMLDNI